MELVDAGFKELPDVYSSDDAVVSKQAYFKDYRLQGLRFVGGLPFQ
jgi:hypothetical protein